MKIFRVSGSSMQPAYSDGDYVVTVRYGRRQPQVGDDVVTQHPDFGDVIKRIERIEEGKVFFAGLNMLSADRVALGSRTLDETEMLRRVSIRLPVA
ncbi:MAG: S24/S26 family peptidase [Pseudomonadota bacterium]